MPKAKVLGRGSYGVVSRVSDREVVKTMNYVDDEYDCIAERNVRELEFLARVRDITHPNILKISSIELDCDKIKIKMPDGGINLHDEVLDTSFNDRIRNIPTILFQLISTLAWMERNNISHGDIKPANILFNNNKISLIDWGGINHDNNKRLNNVCTLQFVAPELMHSPYDQSILSDMFSVGALIRFMFFKEYDSVAMIKRVFKSGVSHFPLIDDIDKKSIGKKIFRKYVQEIHLINKCRDFLALDPDKRPLPSEVLEWEEFNEFRGTYVTPKDLVIEDNIDISDDSLNSFVREQIKWFADIIRNNKNLYTIYNNCVHLLRKYVDKLGKPYENAKFINTCIVLICTMLHTDINISKISRKVYPSYTIYSFSGQIWEIMKDLDFKLYYRGIDIDSRTMTKLLDNIIRSK